MVLGIPIKNKYDSTELKPFVCLYLYNFIYSYPMSAILEQIYFNHR